MTQFHPRYVNVMLSRKLKLFVAVSRHDDFDECHSCYMQLKSIDKYFAKEKAEKRRPWTYKNYSENVKCSKYKANRKIK